MTIRSERMQRVDAMLALSAKLGTMAHWYTNNLNTLRAAWAADPGNAKLEARYKRLSRRWNREAAVISAAAERLTNESKAHLTID